MQNWRKINLLIYSLEKSINPKTLLTCYFLIINPNAGTNIAMWNNCSKMTNISCHSCNCIDHRWKIRNFFDWPCDHHLDHCLGHYVILIDVQWSVNKGSLHYTWQLMWRHRVQAAYLFITNVTNGQIVTIRNTSPVRVQ